MESVQKVESVQKIIAVIYIYNMKYIIATSHFINDSTRKDRGESKAVENNNLMAPSVNNCKHSGPCFLIVCSFFHLHNTVDLFETGLGNTDSMI